MEAERPPQEARVGEPISFAKWLQEISTSPQVSKAVVDRFWPLERVGGISFAPTRKQKERAVKQLREAAYFLQGEEAGVLVVSPQTQNLLVEMADAKKAGEEKRKWADLAGVDEGISEGEVGKIRVATDGKMKDERWREEVKKTGNLKTEILKLDEGAFLVRENAYRPELIGPELIGSKFYIVKLR